MVSAENNEETKKLSSELHQRDLFIDLLAEFIRKYGTELIKK